jgi:hypothetical protein
VTAAAGALSVLFVAPFVPWPLIAGNRVRLLNLLEELAARHSVTALVQVSPADRSSDVEALVARLRQAGVDVHLVEQPNRSLWSRVWMKGTFLVRHAVTGVLVEEHYLNTAAFRRATSRLAATGEYDIAMTTYFFCGIPEILESGIPVVCDASDVMSKNASLARGMSGRRLRYLRQREAAAFSRCAGIVCVHEEDAAAVRSMVGRATPIAVIAHTRDRAGLVQTEPRPGPGHTVAFYGDLGSTMNRDALELLVQDVWPLLRTAEPGVSLVVFGGHGADLEPGLKRAGVQYLGVREDLSSALSEVDVVILPLRRGTGLKGRVLECMEIGIPVVGTANAFEGIQAVSGVDVLVADGAQALADACVLLLRDDALRRQLSESERKFFAQRYGWSQTYGSVHAFLASILERDNLRSDGTSHPRSRDSS